MDWTAVLALLTESLRALAERLIPPGETELPEGVEALTDEELAELEAGLMALAEDDAIEIAALEAAVAVAERTREEAATRIDAAAEAETARQALRDRLLAGSEDEPVAETTEEEPPADEAEDPPAEEESNPDVEVEVEVNGEERELVTAATRPRPSLRGLNAHRPQRNAPANRAQRRAHNRIIRNGGGELQGVDGIGAAMAEAAEGFLSITSGVVDKVRVARILAEYPEERQLGRSPEENTRRIEAVTAALMDADPEAFEVLTAAGGLCGPLTPYYGLARVGERDRPVKAGLQNYQATRGGITFQAPPEIPDFNAAVTQWTLANDETPGSDGPATKPCLTIDCGVDIDATIYAVVECLTFGNIMARTSPERVTNAVENTMTAFARKAESLLLDQLKAGSTAVTAGQALGAARDLLYQIGAAAAGYRSRRRMRRDAVLDLMIPSWTIDMMRDDLARSLDGGSTDRLAVADATINSYLTARNIRIAAAYLDSPTTGGGMVFDNQAASALLDYPDTVEWGLWHPGAWLFLDNGELDLGLVRDSTLNSTNDYQMFSETFEGTAFVGLESLWVTSTVCANGAVSGTVDPAAFCDGEYLPA